ncbi:hypothetical protein ACFVSW_02640 [Neobacillus sp. NPDC058068]|uniref:hypothetical protein n=1 Tax=Neobacillus sp. NPDC058068 TaxID=3346325 RepID=UPI0036DC3F00
MVTAIVIPIICLYFFWLTRKEIKEQDEKWLAVSNVREESVLTGEIKSIVEEKQRFYYHRFIYVQTLNLQTDTKIVTAKKKTPILKDIKIESFTVGEVILVYGCWVGNKFFFSHYEIEKR